MSYGDTPLPTRSGKNQKNSKKSILPKVFLYFFLIVFLCGAAYAGYLYVVYNNVLEDISGGTNEEVPKEELAKEKPITILLLGLDSREETGTMLTDVIMVASLNPERKSASIVSIPRDTYLKVEGYRGRKANQFYSVVSSLERNNDNAAEKVIATTEIKKIFGEFLEVNIDYVSIINFEAFTEIIDQLGGIEVDVDMDMRYVDPTDGTDINLTKGLQTLDGKQALDFVRYRKSNRNTAESSDLERNMRQQKVVAATVDELKSFEVVTKAAGILKAIGNNIETDIPKVQLQSFITTYAGITNENIGYHAIEGVWTSPFIYYDEVSYKTAQDRLREQLN